MKFEEGCVFSLYLIENDKNKGKYFLRGLREELRWDVHLSKVHSYKKIVAHSLLAEQDEKDIAKERQQGSKAAISLGINQGIKENNVVLGIKEDVEVEVEETTKEKGGWMLNPIHLRV